MARWIFPGIARVLLFAVIIVPTQDQNKWRIEKFAHIPPNEVSFSDKGMLVQVKKSASPLIYSFGRVTKINGFRVVGSFLGLPRFRNVADQGNKGADDYPLRVGFVIPGSKHLSGIQRLFAADWIKHLYRDAPDGMGLDHIHFFNVIQNPEQLGKHRIHPSSDFLEEEFISLVSHDGPFEFKYVFPKPTDTIALWISIDGDDTSSEFGVNISKIEITTITP